MREALRSMVFTRLSAPKAAVPPAVDKLLDLVARLNGEDETRVCKVPAARMSAAEARMSAAAAPTPPSSQGGAPVPPLLRMAPPPQPSKPYPECPFPKSEDPKYFPKDLPVLKKKEEEVRPDFFGVQFDE